MFLLGTLAEFKLGIYSQSFEFVYQARSSPSNNHDEESSPVEYDPFNEKVEYWEGIPLPHKKDMVIQIIGKDIKVNDVALSGNIAYTGSMKPAIYGGNRVLQIPYNYSGIKQEGNCPGLTEGQIISFINLDNEEGVETLHRIIDNNLQNGHLRTKGDNAVGTEYVPCEDIQSITVGVLWK